MPHQLPLFVVEVRRRAVGIDMVKIPSRRIGRPGRMPTRNGGCARNGLRVWIRR